ncbi:hypothetical protein [Laribacter hongkongensis]|uniref:hypothetical protein n=1 Tax=Laribacter hongkongensis TaxID=168471 RepID=UPI001EFD6C24|nr:hypothetical protein [Laribacter hongkongensis]MCG9082526.1 hypothetical protein [Laribacter hongkongensis]MCG9096810.1 hypothetical protein [Laribacter hongkongensis]
MKKIATLLLTSMLLASTGFASAADTAPSATAPAKDKATTGHKMAPAEAKTGTHAPTKAGHKKTGHEKTGHKQPEVKTEHKTMPANSKQKTPG